MKNEITVGDTVVLNIQSNLSYPAMVVNKMIGDETECVWFAPVTHEFKKMTFHIRTLIRVNKQ